MSGEDQTGCFLTFLVVLLFACGLASSISGGYDWGYKKGQIDALSGNVKYHLVTRIDSSRVWVEVKEDLK